ncbi:MAG: hypothetical protein IT461_12025 [Planctomycetes bacterium]|nr:hypothetical protein [Planctomycetota bacterium]
MSWEQFYARATGQEKDAVRYARGVESGSIASSSTDLNTCLEGVTVMEKYKLFRDADEAEEMRANLRKCFESSEEE